MKKVLQFMVTVGGLLPLRFLFSFYPEYGNLN